MVALTRLEEKALQRNESERLDFNKKVERFTIEKEAWREKAKKASKVGNNFEDFNQEKPEEPRPTRFITNDATPKKLHELLKDNPAGILTFRDELSGWLATLDKEERATDRGFYLEGWEGTHGYAIDRIGRGTVYAPVCCVSVFGGIQPSRLLVYLADGVNGGKTDDGLLQRLQVLVWPEVSKDWRLNETQPDMVAQLKFTAVFEKIIALDPQKPIFVHFDDEAQELFYTWWPELEARIRDKSQAEAFAAHLSKYRSLMPSLTLLFALADWAVDGGEIPLKVGLKYARLGAAWCPYLESHARKVYACLARGGISAAQILAEKIKSGALPELFTARDVYRHEWSGLTSPVEASRAIEVLIDRGWIRLEAEEREPEKGRPLKRYQVNPKINRGNSR